MFLYWRHTTSTEYWQHCSCWFHLLYFESHCSNAYSVVVYECDIIESSMRNSTKVCRRSFRRGYSVIYYTASFWIWHMFANSAAVAAAKRIQQEHSPVLTIKTPLIRTENAWQSSIFNDLNEITCPICSFQNANWDGNISDIVLVKNEYLFSFKHFLYFDQVRIHSNFSSKSGILETWCCILITIKNDEMVICLFLETYIFEMNFVLFLLNLLHDLILIEFVKCGFSYFLHS